MTRIIAGAAGGTTLTVPSAGTRPTSDRIRESLFGALEAADAVAGARVLDLYAGSGALGLEALSRGAASADLVEKAAAACRVATANAARVATALGAPAARVHRAAAATFLRTATGPFDLVFADPPYAVSDGEVTAVLAALAPLLAADASVVVERATRSGRPTAPPALASLRDRRYGDTTLWWFAPEV